MSFHKLGPQKKKETVWDDNSHLTSETVTQNSEKFLEKESQQKFFIYSSETVQPHLDFHIFSLISSIWRTEE